MGFFSRLFLKNKKTVEEEHPKKETKEMPKEKSGLNEEMVSESVEMESAESDGLPEIFEKAGEEEKGAEEKAETGAPEDTKEENS